MWKTLREVAQSHPGVDIGTFISFATQVSIREQFGVITLPHQTVYGTTKPEELMTAYLATTTVSSNLDSHLAIQREVSELRADYREAVRTLEAKYNLALKVLQDRCAKIGHDFTPEAVEGDSLYSVTYAGKRCLICGVVVTDSDCPKFLMTEGGYTEAVSWLKENGLYDQLQHEQSADGYTTVTLANKLYSHLPLPKGRSL